MAIRAKRSSLLDGINKIILLVCPEKNRRGFTLVETILASIILCGAAVVVGAISTRALNETKLNRQYEVAMTLADRQLTWIDYIGVENFIELGQTEGQFMGFEQEYRWRAVTEYQGIDNLYRVNVTVNWVERNRPYSISVDTMLNGLGRLVAIEEY